MIDINFVEFEDVINKSFVNSKYRIEQNFKADQYLNLYLAYQYMYTHAYIHTYLPKYS